MTTINSNQQQLFDGITLACARNTNITHFASNEREQLGFFMNRTKRKRNCMGFFFCVCRAAFLHTCYYVFCIRKNHSLAFSILIKFSFLPRKMFGFFFYTISQGNDASRKRKNQQNLVMKNQIQFSTLHSSTFCHVCSSHRTKVEIKIHWKRIENV